MLPRRSRLSRHTFPREGGGVRMASPHFSVWTGPAQQGGVSAVISKKVARRSVDRHLLKRRILAVIAPLVRKDRFLVLYARGGSTTLTFSELRQEIISLIQRIR